MTTATTAKSFAEAYADAVIPDMTDAQWNEAEGVRQLNWRGERMPLAQAAELYATIVDGYNEFQPNMLSDLLAEFPDRGIEVTPAREYSVGVYLHVPIGALRRQVRLFVEENFHADEVDWVESDTLHVWWD